jgi:hypothetical protein
VYFKRRKEMVTRNFIANDYRNTQREREREREREIAV